MMYAKNLALYSQQCIQGQKIQGRDKYRHMEGFIQQLCYDSYTDVREFL